MKKQYKIFGTILAIALVLCSVFAIGSIIAGAQNTLAIEYSNVAYNEMTQLAFTIKGTPADGKELGIAVWNSDVEGEKTQDNVSYYNFESGVLEGKTYWLTKGIAASEMSTKLTVAPATRDAATGENAAVAGATFEYSVYDYVSDRLDDTNVTASQMKLYTALVKYGNYAEKIINKGEIRIPYFVANNGTINNTDKGLALPAIGESLTLRADTVNADGDYFLYWTAPDGSKIYDRVTAVTVDAYATAYTANYGTKADSAYGVGINFNDYSVGPLNVVTSNAAKASGSVYYTTGETYHLNNLVHAKAFVQVTSAEDSTIIKQDTLEIKETAGIKYLSFNKNVIISGVTAPFLKLMNPASTKTQKRVDLDISFNTPASEWLSATINLYTTGGDSSFKYTFERDGRFIVNNVVAGIFERGEKINITIDIVDSGFDIYVNGTYVSTKTATLSDGACFKGVCPQSDSGVRFDLDVYTVNYVDTDKFN